MALVFAQRPELVCSLLDYNSQQARRPVCRLLHHAQGNLSRSFAFWSVDVFDKPQAGQCGYHWST